MNIIEVYKQFPARMDCVRRLEAVRWPDGPVCPYCKSTKQNVRQDERYHHCNSCNRDYTVTVGTIFHKTKIDLQKWFLAISLVLNAKKGYAARQLARDIDVNKDTAWYLLMRLRRAMADDGEMLRGIVEVDETYIGGKNENRHESKKHKNNTGRSQKGKTPVVGAMQRDGKVVAWVVDDVKSSTLKGFLAAVAAPGSTIVTDEWVGYKGMEGFDHQQILHKKGVYVDGMKHTNSIEGFWSLIKRGIVGHYHQVTPKHLGAYVREFSFRHNYRYHPDAFGALLLRAVSVERPASAPKV